MVRIKYTYQEASWDDQARNKRCANRAANKAGGEQCDIVYDGKSLPRKRKRVRESKQTKATKVSKKVRARQKELANGGMDSTSAALHAQDEDSQRNGGGGMPMSYYLKHGGK